MVHFLEDDVGIIYITCIRKKLYKTNITPSYLSLGDPLLGKSSLLWFLMELAAPAGASPRSTLDGIGGGPEDRGPRPDTGG